MADIRRQDIIDEKILRIGQEIADSFKKGYSQIKKENANIKKDLQNMVKSAREAEKSLAKASSPKELSEGTKKLNKSQQDLLRTQKLLHDTNIKAEKAAQAKIRTQQLETKETERQKKAQERENREKQKSTVAYQKQQAVKQKAIKQARDEAKSIVNGTQALDRLNKKRAEAQRRLKNLIAQQELQGKETDQSRRAVEKARREFDRLDKSFVKVQRSARQFGDNVGNYPKQLNAARQALVGFIGAFGIVEGIRIFARIIGDAFRRIREFDKELQNIAGILGTTRDELSELEDEIVRVAGSSLRTSNEVAKLASALITLGKTKSEVQDLLEPVNNLSIGLNATSEEAGELLIGTLNAFGESSEAAERYADIIAKLRTSSALNFERINQALGYITPTANALNLTIEETGAIVGVLVDNNIKAQRAGRLMSTAFLRLAKDGKSLESALDDLNKLQEQGADRLEILAEASNTFGAEAAPLALILANNRDKVSELTGELENSQGALEELTNEQLKSLDAQLQLLDSGWEQFIVSLENGEGVIGGLVSTLIKFTTSAVNAATAFNDISEQSGFWTALTASIEAAGGSIGRFATLAALASVQYDKLQSAIDKTVEGVELKTLVDEIDFFEKQVLKALLNTGISFDEASARANIWRQKTIKAFNEVSEETEDSIDDVLTPLQEYARSLEGLSLERLKLETELLTEEQNRLKVAFDKTGDTKYEDKLQAIADKLNVVANAAKIAASSLPSLEGLDKLESITGIPEEKELSEGEKRFIKFLQDKFDLQKEFGDESLEEVQKQVDEELRILQGKNEKEAALDSLRLKDKKKKAKRIEEFERSASNATIRLASDVTNTLFENQQIRLDIALGRLNDEEEAQIESLQRQFEAAQGNAEQQEAIEKRIAQTKEEFAKREAAIKERQARLEKQQALFQIAINTAASVSKTAAELGFPAAIPFIALAVAEGAVQAALVASRPVPQYGEGTDNSEKDFIAGDKGRELILHGNKAIITPDKPTFYKNMKGAKVFSNEDTMKIVGQSIFDPTFMSMDTKPDDRQGKEMVREIQSMHRTLRRKKEYIFDKQPTGWKSNQTKIKRLKNA